MEAIGSHANGSEVARFMRKVLLRHNIDTRGGEMVSSVNCWYRSEGTRPARAKDCCGRTGVRFGGDRVTSEALAVTISWRPALGKPRCWRECRLRAAAATQNPRFDGPVWDSCRSPSNLERVLTSHTRRS
jgi:hypothetical protein